MRRLLLLRHAKAEPVAPDQDDYDRALTARGVADAAALARYLGERGYLPNQILCSPSRRTRQTVAPLLAHGPLPVAYPEALYLAPCGRIVALVQQADDAVVMVVGHNPGLEQGAALLAGEAVVPRQKHPRDLVEEKFPTAALAVLDFEIEAWSELAPHSGKLVDFVRPKDI